MGTTPEGLPTVVVNGTYLQPDQASTPHTGEVDFTVTPSDGILFPTQNVIIKGTKTAVLDAGGSISMELVATDAAGDENPTGWTYTVTERLIGFTPKTYMISLPSNATPVNIADISPTTVAPSYVPVVGATGPQGPATSPVWTVAQYLAQTTPWYAAHRGSGAELGPEHTLQSYRAAVAAGANAIEVSVNLSADGVPICMHDTTVDRTTYQTGNFVSYTSNAFKNYVFNRGKPLLGDGWVEDQHPPTLRQVLDEFGGKVIVFLEAKSNDSVTPIEQMLTRFYPNANQWVIWKAYYQATTFTWAKTNGYTTWGYVDAATTDAQMDTFGTNIDIWGVPKAMTDQRMIDVLNRTGSKPAICWEVHRRSEVTRLRALTGTGTKKAVDGLMCSNWLYVNRATAIRTTDDWVTKVKSPGTIPMVDYDAATSIKFDSVNAGAVYSSALSGSSVGLYDWAPIVSGATAYKIAFQMKYITLPATTLHGGLYFGKVADDKYQFSTANSSGGYHFLLRGNGDMQLYTHTAGVTTGTQLDTINVGTILADTWYSFEIEVNATQVILRALNTPTVVTRTVTNSTYRGLYHGFHNGSLTVAGTEPRFKSMTVTAI